MKLRVCDLKMVSDGVFNSRQSVFVSPAQQKPPCLVSPDFGRQCDTQYSVFPKVLKPQHSLSNYHFLNERPDLNSAMTDDDH